MQVLCDAPVGVLLRGDCDEFIGASLDEGIPLRLENLISNHTLAEVLLAAIQKVPHRDLRPWLACIAVERDDEQQVRGVGELY